MNDKQQIYQTEENRARTHTQTDKLIPTQASVAISAPPFCAFYMYI